MKAKLLIFSILLILTKQFFGQTNLPSTLACNEILTISGSPYIVNTSITIQPNCSLTVEPGVEIKMAENANLIVRGRVDFLGTASQPILIHAQDSIWGNILLDSTINQKSIFKYVHIQNSRQSIDSLNQEPGAIYGYFSTLEVQNCHFEDVLYGIVMYKCNNISIIDCSFDSPNIGEKIHGMYCKHVIVDNNIFYPTYGDCDVIDFDSSNDVMISNNYFYTGGDDGIDLGQVDSIGCDSVIIEGNYIYNMLDKGVSNGELCTNIFINYNVIVGCAMGIGAKSGAYVFADHNTLYQNRMGIKSYHHLNQGWGPGNLTVTNCIISGSDTTWRMDSTAFLSVSYSLSEDTLMPGTGNIIGDPRFVSAIADSSGDFHLLPLSAAVDNGDPAFALDPDGTRSDIGRYYLDQNTSVTNLNQYRKFQIIYPNPGNGKITVRLVPDYKNNRFIILNTLGETIQEIEFSGNKNEYEIDLSSYSSGVYYLKYYSENKITAQQIIIY